MTEADGKPVTESNLSLRAPAQISADLFGMDSPVQSAGGVQNGIFCRIGYLLAKARRSSTGPEL
jgi:hypothetical protein